MGFWLQASSGLSVKGKQLCQVFPKSISSFMLLHEQSVFLSSSYLSNFLSITTRSKHSSRQIKRLFVNNPAKRRIDQKSRLKNGESVVKKKIPIGTIQPVSEPIFLPDGWNKPLLNLDGSVNAPNLPFHVARTKNKPNDALGFLPVYSEHRKDGARVTTRIKKVSGDKNIFLNELRAALQIPISKNRWEERYVAAP